MKTWIVQGNPDFYDIDSYLSSCDYIYWRVTVPKHQKEMSIEDSIYIWRAMGKTKSIPGIVAHGYIHEECKPENQVNQKQFLRNDLWLRDPIYNEAGDIKLGIGELERRLTPEDGMITKDRIIEDEIGKKMSIIRGAQGTSWQLSQTELKFVETLWHWDIDSVHNAAYGFTAQEGKRIPRTHFVHERNSRLVNEAKASFGHKHGRLFCEICGFDFSQTYGELGEDYIQAHHIVPLGEMSGPRMNSVDDFIMVCANCHCIIHRSGKAEESFDRLKELFRRKD